MKDSLTTMIQFFRLFGQPYKLLFPLTQLERAYNAIWTSRDVELRLENYGQNLTLAFCT